MDKFGIFNLLSSLSNLNGQKSTQENSEKNQSAWDKILSALTQNVNTQNTDKKQDTPPAFKPLQSSMLSTMTSHDEFVKRVKQNNSEKKA